MIGREHFINEYNHISPRMKQLSVLVDDDVLEAIENRILASGRSKSDVVRDLLVIGLKKPPSSAYKDLVMDAIAEHEKKFHSNEADKKPSD
ncbi:MAG TPA: ribbon-helix-helix domain-containing protein [Methanothrix sp.]|nr:ribbon-helix-helix domain-containing protein [Methanothrix sp.]